MMFLHLLLLLGLAHCNLAIDHHGVRKRSPSSDSSLESAAEQFNGSAITNNMAYNFDIRERLVNLNHTKQASENSSRVEHRGTPYFGTGPYRPFAPLWKKSYITWSVDRFILNERVPGRDWQLAMIKKAFDDYAQWVPLEFEQVPTGWPSDITFSTATLSTAERGFQAILGMGWYDMHNNPWRFSTSRGQHKAWAWINLRYWWRYGRGHWDYQNSILFAVGQMLGMPVDRNVMSYSVMNSNFCTKHRRKFQYADVGAIQQFYGVRPFNWHYTGPREGPGKDNIDFDT